MPASVTLKHRKSWLLAASALGSSLLGVSEPALAQCTGSPNSVTCTSSGNPYAGGINYGNTGIATTVTLQPGVDITPGSGVNQAVAISTGTGAGSGLPATLIANNAAVTINTTSSLTSALFLHPILGSATITASGVMNVAGTTNTNAIWAATFSSVPGDVASVTYTGSATPGIIDINATGGSNSTLIQACANGGCGFGSSADGNAIINATGNLKGVFGSSGFGLDAVAGGNGTATVNYNGGTIDLMGGSFSDGIFATAGGSATITTLPGTTIIVSSTSAAPTGVEAFAGSGAALANVASTILITGSPTVPTTNYKSNPTGIRAQSDLGGDVSVTSGPSITVHGGGGLGIVAVSGSNDNTTASGRVTVNASGGPIIADGSNAVGILADSGFIRNVFSSGGRPPTTMTGLVDVTASNVSTLGNFGTAISATGGSGGVTVNTSGSIMGGWQANVTSVGSVYGLPATGVVLGSAGGGTATLNNFGSIGALSDRAVASPLPSFSPNSTSPFPTSNNTIINNNGTITGFVELVGGNNSIVNNGLFDLRHFADTTGGGRDTLRVAIADLGAGLNNSFTNSGRLALPAVTGATTLDSTGQYLPLNNPNNAMVLGGPLQGHLIGVQTFTNSGTIDLQSNSAPGDVLVITGARQAGVVGPGTFITGGTLKLNTVLNQGGAVTLSDTLVVDGTAIGANGATKTAILNAGGQGALTVGDGILVVQVLDPARSAAGAFSLANVVEAGPYKYGLFQGGFSPGSTGNWYLRNTCLESPSALECQGPTPPPGTTPPPQVPDFRPETSLYAAIPSLTLLYGRTLLDTLHERVGEEEHLRGRSDVISQPFDNGAWARVIGLVGQRDGDPAGILGSGPKFDYDFAIFQGGHDLYRTEHPDGSRDHAGLYFATGMGSSNVTHFDGSAAGTDKFDALSVGGYWTHFGLSGWYLDGILQGTWYDINADTVSGLGTTKTDATGFASSLEGGYPFRLGGGWLFEPQAQVVYQTVSLGDTADSFAAVRFQDVDSLAARVGVRIAKTWAIDTGPNPRLVTAWVRPNFWREFRGDPRTEFSSETGFIPFHANISGNWAEINLGISGTVNRHAELFANASYDTGFDGRSFAYNGKLGLRVNW